MAAAAATAAALSGFTTVSFMEFIISFPMRGRKVQDELQVSGNTV